MSPESAPQSDPLNALQNLVESLHRHIRGRVQEQLVAESSDELAHEAGQGAGDVSLRIDVPAEESIGEFFDGIFKRASADMPPIVVISEGIGVRIFPSGASEEQARWRVIVDPIDGSRELAYSKRSAWVLTGVAPNRGAATTLADIVLAVQTELPPPHQRLGVVVTAKRGDGAVERLWNLEEDAQKGEARRIHASEEPTIRGGFAPFVHYFPGAHQLIGALADRVFQRVLGPAQTGKAVVFDDQYVSTGGMLYLLASGRYRFAADLRPLVDRILAPGGRRVGLCAHPYDLCTALIVEEAGAFITDSTGARLAYPLDTETDCDWIGYANNAIRRQVEPILLDENQRLGTRP